MLALGIMSAFAFTGGKKNCLVPKPAIRTATTAMT